MDAQDVLDGLLRGALGGRRKRSRGTRRAVGRRGSLINAGTLLAAAGVAWGAYEAWQSQRAETAPSAAGPGRMPPAPGRAGGDTLPPLPDTSAGPSAPVVRLVRLMISAAAADGQLGPEEREHILSEARRTGAEDMVRQELEAPRPLAEIVAGVSDPALKEQLYTLAFSVVRADETVTGGERLYLAGLAHQLGLEQDAVSRLESAAAAAIDAETLEADGSAE
jgi:uncharacterized membrane protein YebE (DUF533 family)